MQAFFMNALLYNCVLYFIPTAMVMCLRASMQYEPQPMLFYANHPFFFYIANKQGLIHFAGKMQKFWAIIENYT